MDYYVYALIDPRNGKPFYIGKGKGNRIQAHERETKRGGNSPKCLVIQSIWEAGETVERRILKQFRKESAAYKYEERLIKKIGLENLTNLASGGENPWRYKPDPGRVADRIYLKIMAKLLYIRDVQKRVPCIRMFGLEIDPPAWFIPHAFEKGQEVINRRGLRWCNKNVPKFRVSA